MIKFDIEFINPMGNAGVLYEISASSPQEAIEKAPQMLAASSQWRPDQFIIISVKISKHEVK